MDIVGTICSAIVVIVLLVMFFGGDVIEDYWKGRASVKDKELEIAKANARTAEANARAAEANASVTRRSAEL